MPHRSIPGVFREQVEALRSRPMVYSKRNGHWRPLTWAQMGQRVDHAAAGLCALGVDPGERVAIVARSSVEWVLADLASLSAGAVDVPVSETAPPDIIAHIVADAGCTAAFVGDDALLERLIAVRDRLPALRTIVHFNRRAERRVVEGLTCVSLLDLERLGAERALSAEVDARVAALDGSALLSLIYTSGTTGEPKGVMLTHGNVIANCEACSRALPVRSDDVLLSFLPLSHSFERTAGYYMASLFAGATIYYAESMSRLFADISEVRPTLMTGVPRVYERIYARFQSARARGGRVRRGLFDLGLVVGRRIARERQTGRSLGLPLRLGERVIQEQLFTRLTARLGDRVRFFVCGGAPLAAEIGEFFHAAGVLILEGYGLTEAAPVVSVNRPGDVSFGTVGRPLDNVRVRIADDGEILVRGPNVMQGYWKREALTGETVIDGWLHTGDIGHLDRDGRLRITDRKKDLFKSSGGKYIAPQRLEGLLGTHRYVVQACVVGDRRPFCIALIVPDFEALEEWAGQHDVRADDRRALLAHPAVDALFNEILESLDARLERHEQLRNFALIGAPFTEDDGLLTSTLKVRRKAVSKRYSREIETVYAAGPRPRRPR